MDPVGLTSANEAPGPRSFRGASHFPFPQKMEAAMWGSLGKQAWWVSTEAAQKHTGPS